MPLASTYARLHRHTCSIQVAAVATTADTLHPGSSNRTVSFDTPATTHSGVRCRLQRLDGLALGELTGDGKAGTVVASHYLWIARSVCPATLLDQDSVPAPEVKHRIVNVAVFATGVIFDTGPFDIQRVVDLAGNGDLVKLELKRVV